MPQVTSVRMRTDTKALLDDLKLNPRETYDDVVRRLTEAAYDDEPLRRKRSKRWKKGSLISRPVVSARSGKL